MCFAEKLQKERRKNNLSVEMLANLVDVPRQEAEMWEAGRSVPGTDKILLLSEIFDVTTDYLLKDAVETSAKPVPLEQVKRALSVKGINFAYRAGMGIASSGALGLLILWVLSILNPPYTFGERLGFFAAFHFYLIYNEYMPLFWAPVVLLFVGIAILLGALQHRRRISHWTNNSHIKQQ